MKIKSIIIFAIIACLFACSRPEVSQNSVFTKIEINENILMIGFGSDMITAVKTSDGIIIIDSGCSTSLTRIYKIIIKNHFNCTEFSYLINTHAHYDHCAGNMIFDDAKIVAHENCTIEFEKHKEECDQKTESLKKVSKQYLTNLQETDKTESIKQIIKYKYASKDYPEYCSNTYCDTTFYDNIELQSGSTNIKLVYFGNLHSTSDILVHLPQEKLLFTGDLFFKEGRASINSSIAQDSLRWYIAAKEIYSDIKNIEYIIGGHGQILDKNDLNEFFKKLNISTSQ